MKTEIKIPKMRKTAKKDTSFPVLEPLNCGTGCY